MSNEKKEIAEETTTKTVVFSNELGSDHNYKQFEVTTKKVCLADKNIVKVLDVSEFEHPPVVGEMPHVGPIVKPVWTWFPEAFLSDMCDEGLLSGILPSGTTALEMLQIFCEKGLVERCCDISPMYMERLIREIDTINQKGFVGGMLIVQDFIRYARSQNVLISPGCGALPGSLVTYCLGITGVDPIKENLLFERYLNKERETHSYGIRIDAEKGARELIFNYLSEKYGKGMPKLLEMAEIYIKEWVDLSITKETIETVLKNKGERIDISKIDCNDPAVYEYLCSGATDGVFYFDKNDPHTYTTVWNLDDDDDEWHEYYVPLVIESEALFKDIKPGNMGELVAWASLDRPMPGDHIGEYVDNKNNPQNISYECPELEPILSETYGCLVYQEQVMQVLQELAGFSPEQSDKCRRALSKKAHEDVDEGRKWFVKGSIKESIPGCASRGVSEVTAEAIYDRLCKDAPCGFNKAHAICFCLMIYDMVWLKYYYEPEFQEAVDKYRGIKSDILP